MMRPQTASSIVKGKRINVPADPPQYHAIPWNSLVVNVEITRSFDSTFTFSPSDIYGLMKAQTGMTDGDAFVSLRLMEIRAWDVAGNGIGLEPSDLTFTNVNDFTTHLVDYPGRNQWARVGYRWPASQQQIIFSGNDTSKVARVSFKKILYNVADTRTVVRFHILWCFRVDVGPTYQPEVATTDGLSSVLQSRVPSQTDGLKDWNDLIISDENESKLNSADS